MALTNVTQFTLGIDRFIDGAEERRKDITRAVALEGLGGVVRDTRVDTGRMRGNWQVGEEQRPEGHKPERGQIGGRADPEITERVDAVQLGTGEILKMDGDKVIWLHNGVPYVGVWEREDKMLVGNFERLKTWIRSQR